jgi:transcriptional regulator with XRE-family HTH domain
MTSPIALYLRKLRLRIGVTQLEFASALGYEQAHLSSFELGKQIPDEKFLGRLVATGKIDDDELDELKSELAASKNRFHLPPDATTETFRFCSALWERLDRLHPEMLSAMHSILELEEKVAQGARHQPTRLRRRHTKEAKM